MTAPPSVTGVDGGLREALAAKDGAYQERDKLVAALARVAKALGLFVWRGYHAGENWDSDWRNIIFIELPTGQVSWHIHDSELPMFADVPEGGALCIWDEHTTPQKYERLLAWRPTDTAGARPAEREAVVRLAMDEAERSRRTAGRYQSGEMREHWISAAEALEDFAGRIERGDHLTSDHAPHPGKTGEGGR